jgi:uncharacterized membrane-anchored protein YitT (DUF2179 family)
LALLASYTVPVPFGVIFFTVNVPFFALAVWKTGWNFTLRTIIAVLLVSALTTVHATALGSIEVNPVYGVLAGNMLAGVGLLILFRHRSSSGGVDILALILQDRFNWRTGYVEMALDVAIVLAAFAFVSPFVVLLSAAGATLLSFILALKPPTQAIPGVITFACSDHRVAHVEARLGAV